MRLTKDALKGALKTANQMYNRALYRDDKPEVRRWCDERNRILDQIMNYDGKDHE